MFKPLEVKKDIYWVGALDFDIRVFDVVMHTDYGTTYNSYVVKGTEKTVLVEIAKERFFDEFYERLTAVCNPEEIDYIVVNHTEPDHTGSLRRLLYLCPKATIVASGTALKFLKEITNCEFTSMVAKEDTTLDIGGKTLKFISVPFLHWPDSMYTYIPESKALFTCDSFGCHYCDENVFNDKIEGDFFDAYKYYYDNIIGPFPTFMQKAIDKIKPLEIETICNGHGPVIRENPQKYIDMYQNFINERKPFKRSVVISYVSAYGYTKKIAERIAEGVKQNDGVEVLLYDLVVDDKDEAAKAVAEAKGILFGTPTIVGDALPPVMQLINTLNPIIHAGKLAGAFGSYGWSGEGVPNIEARLKQLKFNMPLESLRFVFNPTEEQLTQAFEYGKQFGALIK